LKLKERKPQVRHLIEIGRLMVKAKIDQLPSDVLLGACLAIRDLIEQDVSILDTWRKLGADVCKVEVKDKTFVILRLTDKPEQNIRDIIKKAGLKWNATKKEWYGYISDLQKLEANLGKIKFEMDVIKTNNLGSSLEKKQFLWTIL
jgi:hypothetical protein